MSLGDLFVQLGVVGDASEIDDVIKKAQKQLELTEKQIKANEKVKASGKKFEQEFKFDKIRTQFTKFQTGFRAGFSGKNGINGIIKGLGQGFKAVGAGAVGAALAVGAVVGVIAALVVGAVKAYQAIDRLTESLVNSNQQWVNFIHQTDLAFDKLQGYAGVASLFDKSLGMDGAAGSIKELNDRLFELQLTGEGARGFQIGGINPVGQDAFGVLEQVRQRINGLKDTQAAYLLKQIGLDARLLPMLRMKADEFDRLRRIEERYMLTEDQRLEIQKMNMQLELAKQKWQYLKDRAILAIMPHFVRLTKNLTFVVECFIRLNKMVFEGWKKIINLNKALGKTIAIINGLKDALMLLFAPFVAIFKFLYELTDDLEGYMNGRKSLIGVIVYQLNRIKSGLSMDMDVPKWIKMLVYAADKLDKLLHWNKKPTPNVPTPTPDADSSGTNNNLFSKIPFNPLNPLSVAKFLGKKITDNRTINQTNHIYTTANLNDILDNGLRFTMGGMPAIHG